jgi:preprotein translocase subunit SecD
MYKNLRWKILSIFAVAAIAVVAFYPPGSKIRLGLDLKGGLHLVLQVKTDDALRVETETSSEQLREALKAQGILVAATRVISLTEFQIEGVPADKDAQFRQIFDLQYGDSFNRESGVGGSYIARMKPNIEVQRRGTAVEQSVQTIERRVNELGVSEPIVAPYGTAGNQIIVQLPGVTDLARAKEIIRNTAILEVRIIEGGPAVDQATLLASSGGQVPPEMEVMQGSAGSNAPGASAVNEFYLVRKVSAITGRDLRNARATLDEYNQPAVGFTLNNGGVAKFSAVTSANIGRIPAPSFSTTASSRRRGSKAPSRPLMRASRDGSRSKKRTTSRSCCARARCPRRSQSSNSVKWARHSAPTRCARVSTPRSWASCSSASSCWPTTVWPASTRCSRS